MKGHKHRLAKQVPHTLLPQSVFGEGVFLFIWGLPLAQTHGARVASMHADYKTLFVVTL